MPVIPDPNAVGAIVLALVAIYLFTREGRALETSSLLILITILVWFEFVPIEFEGARVRARDFLAGFGNQALITVITLMILARGLEQTGALQPIGHVLAKLWQSRPQLAFLLTLVTAATLSMFLNNTPVVAAILPLLVAVSLQARASPAAILMPVGFATIVGGMATTIGTSTNLLVVGVATQLGLPEFGMFDFALPVVIVGSVAILYLWLVAPRLLPEREPPLTGVEQRVFAGSLRIEEGGYADGRSLAELRARTDGRMRISRITRGSLSLARLPSVVVRPGDVLEVADTPDQLKDFETRLGAKLIAGESSSAEGPGKPAKGEELLAEVVVSRGSALFRRSLNSTRLLALYGILPLALHRPGRRSEERLQGADLGDIMLDTGDILLVQGTPKNLDELKKSGQALVLDGRIHLPRTTRAAIALGITAAAVGIAAVGLMPISITAFCGFGLMLATRCLTWREAIDAVDRRIVMVIVASLALGLAMMATGAAEYVAMLYVALTEGFPVAWVLGGLILIIALLTELVTNNAVAVLGTPIAISIAAQLGAPAEPFVLAVLYGANMSYLTPVGYQTNLLVMSAGGYRFSDFFRAGLPLQLIMWIGLSLVLPPLYGL
ncbi:SLC13 family permease [Lentisalinibacter orientalis]|uniref:SLC13 family permease n=1 Tax=Lentisalinibacter orientalis TaxID=2992241 RepID=UPI0038687B62